MAYKFMESIIATSSKLQVSLRYWITQWWNVTHGYL